MGGVGFLLVIWPDLGAISGKTFFFAIKSAVDADLLRQQERDMTDEFEQEPFGGAEFAENPEPRCPCLLLLDTSYSMTGGPIAELNVGLQTFREEVSSDSLSAKRGCTYSPRETSRRAT